MSRRLFIGIDGGASRCRARITDASGNVLGSAARTTPTNIAARQPALVMRAILAAMHAAARPAKIEEHELKAAYAGFGLAGADVESARNELLRLFRAEGYFRRIELRNDGYTTWLGAFDGADGAILILGTGSCGLAVVGGRETYVSGYGGNISDEASGGWLGRQALRRTLWAFDGRLARTPLAEAILTRFEEKPEAFVEFAKTATSASYGEFAPMVFDYAETGDALGLALLHDAAADAEVMIKRLRDAGAPSVYLHGGIAERLLHRLPRATRQHLRPEVNAEGVALDGAIMMARRAAKGTRE